MATGYELDNITPSLQSMVYIQWFLDTQPCINLWIIMLFLMNIFTWGWKDVVPQKWIHGFSKIISPKLYIKLKGLISAWSLTSPHMLRHWKEEEGIAIHNMTIKDAVNISEMLITHLVKSLLKICEASFHGPSKLRYNKISNCYKYIIAAWHYILKAIQTNYQKQAHWRTTCDLHKLQKRSNNKCKVAARQKCQGVKNSSMMQCKIIIPLFFVLWKRPWWKKTS